MKKNNKNCERPTIDLDLSTKDMLEVMVKGTAVSCKLVKILTNSGSGYIGVSAAFYGYQHIANSTGCPSVDFILDVCYTWIATEQGILKPGVKSFLYNNNL